jgi:MSHA biogenesis protein MshJ
MSAWETAQARFDDLQPRERLLFGVTTAVVLAGALFVAWIEPAEKRAKAARTASVELTQQLVGAREAVARLEAELARDPEAARRAQLQALQAEVARLAGQLRVPGNGVVSPEAMTGLLRRLVAADSGLQVIAARNLPSEVLQYRPPAPDAAAVAAGAEPPPAADGLPALYRHTVELTLRGDYAAIVRYLGTVESQPERLGLRRLTLDGQRWPAIELTVQVETLGLSEAWIGG